jgi:ParB-like chromosome segregation protein Spo0J
LASPTLTNPVLIDEEDGIIAGHGRVRAAHLLGRDEVPCIVLAHLTPAQRRAYVLADNKLALNTGLEHAADQLSRGRLGSEATRPII